MIETARAEGLRLTADVYTYPAGVTSLDACIPPWAHDGGQEKLLARLKEPNTRAQVIEAIKLTCSKTVSIRVRDRAALCVARGGQGGLDDSE